jgi:hypothetical protein
MACAAGGYRVSMVSGSDNAPSWANLSHFMKTRTWNAISLLSLTPAATSEVSATHAFSLPRSKL